MYGNGVGPTAGGSAASVLAYTGTGSMLLPLILASIAMAVGIALYLRQRYFSRSVNTAA